MMAFFSGIWAKLALGAIILAALGLFIYRVYKAGGDAARLETARKNLQHVLGTQKETNRADQNLTDPLGSRAQRVRDRFTRRS